MRYFCDLTGPALVDTLGAPVRPAALEPVPWFLPEVRATIEQVRQAYFPPVAEHLRTLLGDQ